MEAAADQGERSGKVTAAQVADRERAFELEESQASYCKWAAFRFCALFCFGQCMVTLLAKKVKYPNKWDLFALHALCTGISFCAKQITSWKTEGSVEQLALIGEGGDALRPGHSYTNNMQSFCTLYLAYYMIVLLLMAMAADAVHGWLYCCSLSISLMAYASLLSTILQVKSPSAKFIRGSIVLAVLAYAFARGISKMEGWTSLSQSA